MKRYSKWIAWMLAMALMIMPLAGCSNTDNSTAAEPDTQTQPAATESSDPEQSDINHSEPEFTMEDYTLVSADNYEQIGTLFNGIISGDAYSSSENVGVIDTFFSEANRPAFGGNYGERSNSTQLLPAGVTAADAAVAADGYIYRVQDGELTIVSAKGKTSEVVSTTTVASTAEGYESYEEVAEAVAVSGNIAAVVTYVYAWKTVDGAESMNSETVSQTHVKFYDITDKAAPKQVADFVQDGSYQSAYVTGGRLYLLTDFYVMNMDAANAATFIPKAGAADKAEQIKAENLLVNNQTDTARFTVVSALDMQSGAAKQTQAITGSYYPCFADDATMLLSGWCYAVKQSEPYEENQYQVTDFYSHAVTLVAKFDLSQGLALQQTACVNGRMTDPDQADFADGYLRMATMAEHYTNRLFEDAAMGFANLEMGTHFFSNEISVLDQELKLVGHLEGLSDSCLTYYTRLIGSTGYVLAYDLDNTVYTLDLTDPAAPAMGESLSKDDPAEILLRCGDRLLGITAGGKLQLLEAEGAALNQVADVSIGENYTAIRYHMDSVLCDAAAGIAVLPGADGMYVYAISESDIEELGKVEMNVTERTRVMLADGLLYVTGDIGVIVVDPATCETVAQVTVAVG